MPCYILHMKTNHKSPLTAGLTFIEMLVIIALIAVISGMLIPPIVGAVNKVRLNDTFLAYNDTIAGPKDWAMQDVLLDGAWNEKDFPSKLGEKAVIRVVPAESGTTKVTAENSAFDFKGQDRGNDASGPEKRVILIKIRNVAEKGAIEVSRRIDGEFLSNLDYGPDLKGRVKYATPTNGVTDIYIYVAHK